MAQPDWLQILPVDIIKAKALKHGLDWRLVAAICQTESGGNAWAIRFEPQYKWFWKIEECAKAAKASEPTMRSMQATSWGLMQVMGAVAYENGFPKNQFVTRLLVPSESIEYGCRLLSKLWNREHQTDRMIASYNAGSVRVDPVSGKIVNEFYINKVLGLMGSIRP